MWGDQAAMIRLSNTECLFTYPTSNGAPYYLEARVVTATPSTNVTMSTGINLSSIILDYPCPLIKYSDTAFIIFYAASGTNWSCDILKINGTPEVSKLGTTLTIEASTATQGYSSSYRNFERRYYGPEHRETLWNDTYETIGGTAYHMGGERFLTVCSQYKLYVILADFTTGTKSVDDTVTCVGEASNLFITPNNVLCVPDFTGSKMTIERWQIASTGLTPLDDVVVGGLSASPFTTWTMTESSVLLIGASDTVVLDADGALVGKITEAPQRTHFQTDWPAKGSSGNIAAGICQSAIANMRYV